MFKTVQAPEDGRLKVQFDYLSAYFDFYTGADTGYAIAKKIAAQYEEYPVVEWKMLFLGI